MPNHDDDKAAIKALIREVLHAKPGPKPLTIRQLVELSNLVCREQGDKYQFKSKFFYNLPAKLNVSWLSNILRLALTKVKDGHFPPTTIEILPDEARTLIENVPGSLHGQSRDFGSSVGRFPEHLLQITELVSDATDHIYVFGDCVDYGCFGAPKLHDRYMTAILDARTRGVSVTYLVWGPPQAFSAANKFPDCSDDFREREDAFLGQLPEKAISRGHHVSTFMPKLEALFQNCARKHDWYPLLSHPRPLEKLQKRLYERTGKRDHELDVLLLCLHEWVVQEYEQAGAAIHVYPVVDARPDLFCWIIDSKAAMFLHPTDDHALAFRAGNDLAKTFARIFQSRLDDYMRWRSNSNLGGVEEA